MHWRAALLEFEVLDDAEIDTIIAGGKVVKPSASDEDVTESPSPAETDG